MSSSKDLREIIGFHLKRDINTPIHPEETTNMQKIYAYLYACLNNPKAVFFHLFWASQVGHIWFLSIIRN